MDPMTEYIERQTRRQFLGRAATGMGSLALASMLDAERAAANPLSPKPTHVPGAKAKSVIFLFMAGGPSHVDTFDPKPLLNELDGKPRPTSFGDVKYRSFAKTRDCWDQNGSSLIAVNRVSRFPICFGFSIPDSEFAVSRRP